MVKTAYRADALLLLAAFIWGTAFVAQRLGMQHMGPLGFNGVRFALGALILLPFALKHTQQKASRTGLIAGAGLAGLILFLGASLQQAGLVYTTAGKAGFITGLYVIIVPFLGLFVNQRATGRAWVGAGLATAGLYLLSVHETFSIAYGDLLVLLAAGFWAAHILVLGRFSPRLNPFRLACGQFTVCALLSLLAALFTEPLSWASIQGAGIPILYGGILSVGIGYTLQVAAQQQAPSAHAAIILSLEAVFAALAGWAVLSEILHPRELLGCGLMLVGMLVAQLSPCSKKQAETR